MLKVTYTQKELDIIDQEFLSYLKLENAIAHRNLLDLRNRTIPYTDVSKYLIDIAFYLDSYLVNKLNLLTFSKSHKEYAAKMSKIAQFKKHFIQRDVAKNLANIDISCVAYEKAKNFVGDRDILDLYSEANSSEEILGYLRTYVAYNLKHNYNKSNILYYLPRKLDFQNLIACDEYQGSKINHKAIAKDGFALNNEFRGSHYSFDQTYYCIFCHNQGKDSCSKGLKDKESQEFKRNDLGITLAGCPLEEKISEMNYLKSEGLLFAPLAMAMIDNPMLPLTGHRICNDCMKACIYQKQEPVDIPHIESQVLMDVLECHYGIEIYNLLTYWNPLNISRPMAKPLTNKNVMVVGSGPAGINAAYHLAMEGNYVTMIDGLRIMPLDDKYLNNLIENIKDVFVDLEQRTPRGFGGVAEYGITNRWNKNFLDLVRIVLQRRQNFLLIGGIRFGSNITYNQVKSLGFDHIVLACGAGKPNLPEIENILVKGVKTASDFLMNLQSGGAFNLGSMTNLEVRFPAIVIGGGLTAIDTATEILAYYPRMLENLFNHLKKIDYQGFRASLSPEENIIFAEYEEHWNAIKDLDNIQRIEFLRSIGGVKILYRKDLVSSPAYKLNHEEIELALKQGIEFIENVVPIKFNTDNYGSLESVSVIHDNETKILPAKMAFIAAGTNPNNMAIEGLDIEVEGNYIKLFNEFGVAEKPEKTSKPVQDLFIAQLSDISISVLGDMHPSFQGNVVKAMASAKRAYPVIQRLLDKSPNGKGNIFADIKDALITKVHSINILTPTIIEIILESKFAAINFEPGTFYKFQDFSGKMEGIALTGAWVDKDKGLVSLIALEMGASSKMCRHLKIGEEVCLMGPTGTPTEIYKNKKVMLIGGGLGNAVLFSIGRALKANGCFVIYAAGYRKLEDIFKPEEIEKSSDITIWCSEEGVPNVHRSNDMAFKGNILDGISEFAKNYNLSDIEHVITIGSDRMMAAVTANMRKYTPKAKIIASINSPMQCMMKEICASCIQEHIDRATNEKTYIYSCRYQDQDAEKVNFAFLNARLKQNSILEKITNKLI